MIKKLKYLFIPFILVSTGQALVYTFLHWSLIVHWELTADDRHIFNIIIPPLVSMGLYYAFLRRRIHLLQIHDQNGKAKFAAFLMITAFLAIPTIFAQYYMQKQSGKLTYLDDISQIGERIPTKYYDLKKYYIDNANFGIHYTYKISGKHNHDYNMLIYYSIPVLADIRDTVHKVCNAWCTLKYQKTINNNLDSTSKQDAYNAFAQKCQQEFDTINFENFVYFERLDGYDIENGYYEAITNNSKYTSQALIFLEANKEPFEMRAHKALKGLLIAFAISTTFFLILIFTIKFDSERLQEFLNKNEPQRRPL